jgi:hypothetical protein
MAHDGGQRAGAVYAVALRDAEPGSALRRVRDWVHLAASELMGGLVPAPELAEVVIAERGSGREVLVRSCERADAGTLLAGIEAELDSLTVEEFRASWHLDA